jgi:hypothetical protein
LLLFALLLFALLLFASLLRAQAKVFRCKSRLGFTHEGGNFAALALRSLRSALMVSKGHSMVTALEIGDALHEAAWRYETDLSTGKYDKSRACLLVLANLGPVCS